MSETVEQEALRRWNEVTEERGQSLGLLFDRENFNGDEAFCRLIEEHRAFKQKVSDVAVSALAMYRRINESGCITAQTLAAFIIKPPADPLVEALNIAGLDAFAAFTKQEVAEMAESLRAELSKRGITILKEA